MKKVRESIQVILVIICFVTFKQSSNLALQLALYMVLNAIIIQEFLHIYNAERAKDKNGDELMNYSSRYWRLAGIVILELFVIGTLYYLSTILVDSLQKL